MNPAIFFHPDQRLVALPGIGPVRMLLDVRYAWSAARWYPAQRFLARAVCTAARLAALLRRGVMRERLCAEDMPEWARELAPLRPAAVLVGTPGPAQKLTVRFDTPEGQPALFAKIAYKPAARRRLENEVEVLRALPRGFAPVPVAHHRFDDHDVLIIEAVEGRALRDTRRDGEKARRYLEALAATSARPAEGVHPWLVRAWHELPELRPHVERLAARKWPVVPVHGDFAPWNLLAGRERVVAIDWEYGTVDGLPGIDAAAWRLKPDSLIQGKSPRRARLHATKWVKNCLGVSCLVAEDLVRVAAGIMRSELLLNGRLPNDPVLYWQEQVAFG